MNTKHIHTSLTAAISNVESLLQDGFKQFKVWRECKGEWVVEAVGL